MVVATQRNSSSPIHPASLVDSTSHSPALLEMIEIEMSRPLIEYVVDTVIETVDYAMGHPSSSRGRSVSRRNDHAKFSKFVNDVVEKAEVKVPALLVTLVYIDRAKPHLQIALEQWANERVFLGALILANKYLNDSTLKNVHWALCTGVFGKRDIGRIEREFLDVLDFELGITEDDVLSHHGSIMSVLHPNRHSRLTALRPAFHRRSAVSQWSSDSDMDSVSSAESSSPPRTPDISMEVDPASYLSPTSKPDPHSHSMPVQQFAAEAVVPHKDSHRFSTAAMNLLRSFPLPNFSHPPSTSASSASLSTTSSGASSNASCRGRCKPIAPAQIVTARTTSVFV